MTGLWEKWIPYSGFSDVELFGFDLLLKSS